MKQRVVFWSGIGFIALYLSALISFSAFQTTHVSIDKTEFEQGIFKSNKSLEVQSGFAASSSEIISSKGQTTLYTDYLDLFVKDVQGIQILFIEALTALQFKEALPSLHDHLSKILYPFHSFW